MVISVEAHSLNFYYLLKNLKLNNTIHNVKALNIAAWSKDGWIELYISENSGHHSIMMNFGKGKIKVKCRVLDHLLDELHVNRVNWIKIDVEGAGYEVLKGLKNTLRKMRPNVIVEIWYVNLSKI